MRPELRLLLAVARAASAATCEHHGKQMSDTDRTKEDAEDVTAETQTGALAAAGDDGTRKPAATADGTKPPADKGDDEDEDKKSGPDPFFWPVVVGLILAVIAAFEADASTPSFALGSLWLYRFEVGLAVFIVCYVLALTVCLAWQGRSFGRFELPGGGGADPADPSQKLDKASEEVDDFQTETRARFEIADSNFADIESRLDALEADQRRLLALREAEDRIKALQERVDAVERERS